MTQESLGKFLPGIAAFEAYSILSGRVKPTKCKKKLVLGNILIFKNPKKPFTCV